jgi:hypothetical protein
MVDLSEEVQPHNEVGKLFDTSLVKYQLCSAISKA